MTTTGKKTKAGIPAKEKGETKPKVDPVFGDLLPEKKEEPEGEPREKRKYKKREKTVPLFEDRFFSLIWEKIFIRVFPGQPLSGEESQAIGSSSNIVISKYIPELLARYSDELMLAFNISMAVMIRWKARREGKENEDIPIFNPGDSAGV